MIDLGGLSTEGRNPETMDLDTMSSLEIVEVMNREDARAVASVTGMLPRVAQAADWAIEAISSGGRLIYVGAGTSGRLGVLDAVECPPTFGVSPDVVVGLIAGGEDAFVKAVEGAEGDMALCVDDLKEIDLKPRDVVIGLAASGRTPYVIGGLRYARELGCKTVAIACNRDSQIGREADLAIEPVPGPEVLTGSTRLKAGTVQKLILNMISTATMVGIGKAYENLMVDVQQTNEKLRARAQNIVMEATGCTREEAVAVLADAGGRVKTAVVMVLAGLDAREAESALEDSHGHVRGAVVDEVVYVSAHAADAGTMRAVWRFLNERMPEIRYVPYESYDRFEEQILSNPEFDPKGFKIALEKGEVVGVCGVLSCSDLLPTEIREEMPSYLYLLAVDPHYRRRGIGSEMLAQAEAYALEQGNWGLRVSLSSHGSFRAMMPSTTKRLVFWRTLRVNRFWSNAALPSRQRRSPTTSTWHPMSSPRTCSRSAVAFGKWVIPSGISIPLDMGVKTRCSTGWAMSRIGRNFERRCWRALTSSWRFTTTARYAESQARCRLRGQDVAFSRASQLILHMAEKSSATFCFLLFAKN